MKSSSVVLWSAAAWFGVCAEAASVKPAAPPPRSVGRYEMLDLPLDVQPAAKAPFDSREIRVDARITSPSGRKLVVPCFLDQPFQLLTKNADDDRRAVRLVKIYVNRREWPKAAFRLFIDDVELRSSRTGECVSIGRFDAGPAWRGAEARAVVVETEDDPADKVLCLNVPPGRKGWPGATLDAGGDDWRGFDSLSFWIYPDAAEGGGIGVEYYTPDGRKFARFFSPRQFKFRRWNRLEWKWKTGEVVKGYAPAGPSQWRLRFTPSETGRYSVELRVAGRVGAAQAPAFSFECRPGKNTRGFVRTIAHKRYFRFDDGEPFFAIGQNVCWPRRGIGVTDFKRYFDRMAANRENYARIWMCPWSLAIQWGGGPDHYRLDQAWALDHVLDLAQQRGIYVMLCLDWHGCLKQRGMLKQNPYFRANGGPCDAPRDFFTNPEARRLYKDRLRYLVARYGARTNLFAWEFWNEVDITDDYDEEAATAWHQEMARYLRGIDPYRHLITTSTANADRGRALWALPEIDFSQVHRYNADDKAADILKWCADRAQYDKPYLIGEFGFSAPGRRSMHYDARGLHLHNAIWASAMAGSAGTAMIWWWDNYVHPNDLYFHYRALAAFARRMPWVGDELQPFRATVEYAPGAARAPISFRLAPSNGSWKPASFNRPNTFHISKYGEVKNEANLSAILHGLGNHPDLHNPATFEIDAQFPGRFVVEVLGVSGYGGANLRIDADGARALSRDFPDPDGEDDTATLTQFNGDYAVTLTAGPHTVKVENTGKDWARVAYRLEKLCAAKAPPARAVGLRGRTVTALWIQNEESSWAWTSRYGKPSPVKDAQVAAPAPGAGPYEIEWWDTWRGRVVKTERAKALKSRREILLRLPPIERDAAVLIRPTTRE